MTTDKNVFAAVGKTWDTNSEMSSFGLAIAFAILLAYKADCFNLIWQLNEFINETETFQDAQLV